MKYHYLLAAMLLAATSASAANLAPIKTAHVSCPRDAKLATLLAGSDVVLIGKLDVPRQRLADEARKPAPDYIDIPVQVDSVLKGAPRRTATIRFHPREAAYKPSNDTVLGLAGEPALLFLVRIDEGPGGLYFAGDTPDALKRATAAAVSTTQVEVSRQAQIIATWRPDPNLPRFAEVRALIARLGRVSGNEQQRVFDRLETLGTAAVPAIIAQMDDRRPLRTQAISLVNHAADAFEGTRHYGPEKVVDGLDAVLNQITGQSFGSIENGGSDRQRDAEVAGWRIYAADLRCRE